MSEAFDACLLLIFHVSSTNMIPLGWKTPNE
nr:MAG TPA: hypothetical protein [Caudoviricetes sp.]